MSLKNISFLYLLSSVFFSSCQHEDSTEMLSSSCSFNGPKTANHISEPVLVHNHSGCCGCDPDVRMAEKKIKKLSPLQKRQLAFYIIHSANWERILEQALEQIRNEREDEMLSMWHSEYDSYMNRIIIPYIRASTNDKSILSLIDSDDGIDGHPAVLPLIDIFDFVAEYYIEHNPNDKNAWNFLWFFSGEGIDRAAQSVNVELLIKNRHLDRYQYGEEILDMIDARKYDGRSNFGLFL